MKRQRLQLVALQRVTLQLVTLAVLALSCEPELSREEALAEKPCAGEADCVEGYTCGLDSICVRSSSMTAAAGSANGGTNEIAGNGNDPRTSGSSDGGSSAGGASGSGGSAGSMSGGNAGNQSSAGSGSLGGAEPDAGGTPPDPPDAPPATDGGCTPIRIFRDLDGDGFGSLREEDQALACSVPEGFVTVGEDCFDGPTILNERAEDVHPGQTAFFFVGYHFDPNDISVVSFDYDCSGTEDRDPTNNPDRAAVDCSQVSLPCPAPRGWEPTDRSGDRVDILCGSEFTAICMVGGDTCVPNRLYTTTEPFRCH